MALAIAVLDISHHDRDAFTCGAAALDDYLRQRAGQHQRDGIATTHVLIDDSQPTLILAIYPIPAVRVGRLAVSKGYGQLLLGHAVDLALSVRRTMGVRVLVVDAKDAQVAAFYEGFGFRRTVDNALTLYLPIGRS